MNIKRAITIGLLTATAVGLVACATTLKKFNNQKTTTPVFADNMSVNTTQIETTHTYTTKAYTNNEIKIRIDVENELSNYEQYTINKLYITTTIDYITPGNIIFAPKTQKITKEITQYIEQITKVNPIITSITCSNFNQYAQTTDINIKYTYDLCHGTTTIARTDENTITINATTNVFSANYIDSQNNETINFGYFDIQTYNRNEINLYIEGLDSGYTNGYNTGYTTGYTTGENYGYETGYTTGYQMGGDMANGNFKPIQEVMLNVLTMPFSFITQAFNVTLWEGTDYEFNFSTFIMSLISVATIIFIINLFIHGFTTIGNYTTSREKRELTRSQTKLNKAKTEKIKKETK